MPITSASPYVWNFDGDGDWSTAADWTPSGPPPDASNVRIDTPDEHTVTFSSGTTTIRNLYVGNDIFEVTGGTFGIGSNAIASFADKLMVTGGTLELNGASALAAAFDQEEGGTVDGSGTLLVSGAATLGNGSPGDFVVETGSGTTLLRGTTSVNAGICLDGGRVLENAGTLTANDSVFNLGFNPYGGSVGGATIRNDAGATFDAVNGVTFFADGGATAFVNDGTFETTGTAATTAMGPTFANTGTVSVQTGTLELGDGFSSGSIAVSSGATLATGGTFTVTGSYDVLGETAVVGGTLDLSAATLTALGSDLNVSGGKLLLGAKAATVTTLEQTDDTGNFGYSIIDGSSTLTVTGAAALGATTNNSPEIVESGTGTTLLQGATTVTQSVALDGGRVFENAGTLTASGGATFDLGYNPNGVSAGGATIKNDAGATFDVDGGGVFNARNGTTAFVNDGTFETTGADATTVMAAPFTNDAAGTVSVQTGTLQLQGGGSSAGAIAVASGATLDANSGTFAVTGSFANSGETVIDGGTLDLSGATLTALGSDLSVSNGTLLLGAKAASVTTLEFSGGTIDGSGTLTVSGAAALSTGNAETGTGTTLLQGTTAVTGFAPLDGGRVLENAGTLTASGATFLLGFNPYGTSAGGGAIENDAGATFDVVGGGTILGQSGTTSFVNDGTFETTGAPALTVVATPFTNDSTGTVSVQTGTLQFQNGGSSAGAIAVASGASFEAAFHTFTVTGGYNVSGQTWVSGGTLDLSGATLTALGSDLKVSGGKLLLGAQAASVASLEQSDPDGGSLFLSTIDGSGRLTVTGAAAIGDSPDVLESGTGTTLLKGVTTVSHFVALDGGRVFENAGTLTAGGDARFDLGYNPSATSAGGATIKNDAGATWDVDGGGTYQARNGVTAFVNDGTFETTGTSAATNIAVSAFTNNGTVSVQTGSLEIAAAMTGSGSVTVASGATFTLDASSTSTANTVNIGAGDGMVDLTGGLGHDSFSFDGDFTGADIVNGGTGAALDRIAFTGPVALAADTFANVSHIEQLMLAAGTNSVALTDAMVGSADDNHLLTVYGSTGNDTVDGRAVTAAANALTILAYTGNDTLTGGAGADMFVFAKTALDGNDTVDGGTGAAIDSLDITTGGGTGGTTLFAHVSHIEKIIFGAGNHTFTATDALVSSADDNHVLTLLGNAGTDVFFAQAVTTATSSVRFEGLGGGDRFTFGAGADRAVYVGVSDSTGNADGTAYDSFVHFNVTGGDRIDLPNADHPASIATVSSGTLNSGSGTFDSDMANAIGSSLAAHSAVDFHVTAGTLHGHEFLVVNPTGSAGYVSGADYVFDITGHTGTVTTGTLI